MTGEQPCLTAGRLGVCRRLVGGALAVVLALATPAAADLEDDLGRNEVRIYTAAVPVPIGQTVLNSALLERLEGRGYQRVHSKPSVPGEYFFGESIFWVFRRAYTIGEEGHDARLFGMAIGPGGVIQGVVGPDRSPVDPSRAALEPLLLSESLDGDRAPRILVRFENLPGVVWRAVLAAEDHRFFDHHGLDGKAIARALLKNLKRGEVTQGGSTITQQLVKNRDLSPKRSLGRKASEAMRALALESEYSKEEILQAYLNTMYMGHLEGVAIYGLGAASEAYFSTSLGRLDLSRAAALAALVQGPNRLHPVRHPDSLAERRNWVIDRMEELGWVDSETAAAARRQPLRTRPNYPTAATPKSFIRWTAEFVDDDAPKRSRKNRGVVVESSLDPFLQNEAERAVRDGLRRLLGGRRGFASGPLHAALIALDVETGDVLAHVAADPARPDAFDRVRSARRQPGSAIKPLLLLESFQDCGRQGPLHPATRVADAPLTIDLPSGGWSPSNPDNRFRGVVEIRDALEQSLNVPFVRVAEYCGLEHMADRVRQAGLGLPPDLPPSFVLGSIETTPLELVRAYTAFATPGSTVEPRPVHRLSAPGGRRLHRYGVDRDRVTEKASAYLVDWLLEQAVESGTARGARLEGVRVAAKTGTSSGGRDAWLAGHAGSVVTVVWVGRDDDQSMGLSGSTAAAPIWREFMAVAARARPARTTPRPEKIVEAYVDPKTGLRVRATREGARPCLFRKGVMPRKKRPILRDPPEMIIE